MMPRESAGARRVSVAAVALISSRENGELRWLAQWNDHWASYNLVGGHKRPGESFRECIERELGEELSLREGLDYVVSDQPTVHVEFDAWSESAQAATHYIMEVFDTELVGATGCAQIAANPANRWLTEGEIQARQCSDGKPVSKSAGRLLGARAYGDRP